MALSRVRGLGEAMVNYALTFAMGVLLGIAMALHPDSRPIIRNDVHARMHASGALILAGALFLMLVTLRLVRA